MVATPAKVLIDQSLYTAWIEVAPLKSSRLQQNRQDQILQFITNPVHQRERETLLGPVQGLLRYSDALGQFAQDVFLLSSTHFPFHRETCDPFHKKVIKKRNSHLQRGQHTHSIDLGQNVTDQVSLGINVQHLTDWIFGRGLIEIPVHRVFRITLRRKHLPELIGQER